MPIPKALHSRNDIDKQYVLRKAGRVFVKIEDQMKKSNK